MRICLIAPSLLKSPPIFGGAIETFIYELGENLAKLKNFVIIITRNGHNKKNQVNSNLTIISLNIPSNSLLRGLVYNFKIIKTILTQKQIDILHTQGTANFPGAFYLSQQLNIPIIHTEHVYNPWIKLPSRSLIKRIKYPIDLFLGRIAFKYAKKITVSTDYIKKSIELMNPNVKEKLEIVPQGINTKLFNNSINSQYLRKKYNYSKTDKIILYVGRIIPEKNIKSLLKAFKNLNIDLKNLKLLLVGPKKSQFPTLKTISQSSKYYSKLKKWIQRNNLQDIITITGAIPYKLIPYYYAGCDLFVQPSFLETYGRSVFEAAAVGVPIISYKFGSMYPAFLHESSGIFLSRMNSINLLNAMKQILLEPKYKVHAIKAAQKLGFNYNWGKIAKNYLEVYQSAIKN